MNILHKKNVKDFFERAIRTTKLDIQRETLLENIANKIVKTINNNGKVNIIFIGSNNSRRSQFAQVWAYFAMEYYNINNGFSFSCGANPTAFFTSTQKALEGTEFKFSLEEFNHQNPKYLLSYVGAKKELIIYSKGIEEVVNKTPFVTITTSENTDKDGGIIIESSAHFYLPYTSPKWNDDEENVTGVYLNTSKLIAGEMGLLFKKVKDQLL